MSKHVLVHQHQHVNNNDITRALRKMFTLVAMTCIPDYKANSWCTWKRRSQTKPIISIVFIFITDVGSFENFKFTFHQQLCCRYFKILQALGKIQHSAHAECSASKFPLHVHSTFGTSASLVPAAGVKFSAARNRRGRRTRWPLTFSSRTRASSGSVVARVGCVWSSRSWGRLSVWSVGTQENTYITHTHTHTHLMAFFPGLPGWAGTTKVKPIWILLKQETVSGSGISWAMCKSAPHSRQTIMPAPHHSVFAGRMPFLPPNQQHQSTEGKNTYIIFCICLCHLPLWLFTWAAINSLQWNVTPTLHYIINYL